MATKREKIELESKIRNLFNQQNKYEAESKVLHLGYEGAKHKFDMYEQGKIIGGITTSPWKNKTGSTNTGGQDRVSNELLWLSLWRGSERRVEILTDLSMAKNIIRRWKGCDFPHHIEIIHFDESKQSFSIIGTLFSK